MSGPRARIEALIGENRADRVVPPAGFTVSLTVFSAAAMAFLAVFALALAVSAGRLAERWASALAETATVRVAAPEGQTAAQAEAVMDVLETTAGVDAPRRLPPGEVARLLRPWFGRELPVGNLPLPTLIEFRIAPGLDAEGLRLRLAGEAPGAVLDDHTRWREPLVTAAGKLRALALLSAGLIAAATAAMVALAANAALAANRQVIEVLRLVGARDMYIARAFVRRFTRRAGQGAALGTVLGLGAVALMPGGGAGDGPLSGLGFRGAGWLAPAAITPLAALVAYLATRLAAFRMLRGVA